jgi:hypothetical protein
MLTVSLLITDVHPTLSVQEIEKVADPLDGIVAA